MNAPNRSSPALFASVRSSKDRALAAFAGALLVAFALQAGAFLPRLGAPEATERTAAVEVAPNAPARPVVARRPSTARGAPAAAHAQCQAPRG